MRAPRRVQMRRDVAWQDPSNKAVIVDRSTKWGNTSRVDFHAADPVEARRLAVEYFRTYVAVMQAAGHYVFGSPHGTDLFELRGRDIACWCPLPVEGEPDFCHGALLKELANVPEPIPYMPITEEPE